VPAGTGAKVYRDLKDGVTTVKKMQGQHESKGSDAAQQAAQ
jgi:hypothetical protein